MNRIVHLFVSFCLAAAPLSLAACSDGSHDDTAADDGTSADGTSANNADNAEPVEQSSSAISASGGTGKHCHWVRQPGRFCPETLLPGSDCRATGKSWHWEKVCQGGPPTAGK